jgi:colanic acid/amylovoran biosynthesis glycosyltransferase
MVSRFPLVTETFILRELIELERQGQPVLLVPMLKESPQVVHEEAKPWMERALYTPYVSEQIGAANLRALLRQPLRYLSVLARLILGSLRSPGFLGRTLAIFPKSVFLAEQLDKQSIRHIHAHFATHPATMAWIVSKLSGITYSITAHAHDIFVDRALLRLKLRHAAFIRTISNFNRRYLASRFPESSAKIDVIHVGIDPVRYESHLRVPASPRPRVLCIGALKPYKGIPVLVEACDRLTREGVDFHCEIIGDGPMRAQIAQMIRTRGLHDRVILLGSRTQEEVGERIAPVAIVVQPSIIAPDGQMEGIPVSLMEAMAAGKPVIASELSGIPELVEHGKTGLLVEPGSAAALAEAMRELLGSAPRRAEMGKAGHEKVTREFVLSGTVEQLLGKIDQLNPSPDLTDQEIGMLGSTPIGVRRTHRREDSRVVEIRWDDADLILKTQQSRPGESRPPIERARHEFEILERLATRGMAPRPIRRQAASILMERARGRPLDGLIREFRRQPDQLAPSFHAAGTWLREFQSLIENAHHGDFWPGNIFISSEGVQVIDFEGVGAGAPYQDVAGFLVEAELFFSRPWDRRHFPLLRNAFLNGYLVATPLDATELTRCRIAKLRSLRSRARSAWRRYAIRTLLQREARGD